MITRIIKTIKTKFIELDVAAWLFWVGFACVLCDYTFFEMCFQNILSGGKIRDLGVVFLLLKVLLDIPKSDSILNRNIKLLAIISGIGSYFRTGETEVLVLFTVVVAASSIDYDKILKFFTVFISIAYTLNLILVTTGIKICGSFLDYAEGHNMKIRYDLGYLFPNHAMFMLINIFLCMLLLFRERIRKEFIVFITVLAIVVFKFTDSRGGIIVFAATLILAIIAYTPLRELLGKIYFPVISFVGTMIFMFGYSLIFKGERVINISLFNTFESRAIALGLLRNHMTLRLFGNTDADISMGYPVDCTFFHILIYFGILAFIVYVCFYFICIFRNKNDYYFGMAVSIMSLTMILQRQPMHVNYSILLLAVFARCQDDETSNDKGMTNEDCINLTQYIKKSVNYAFVCMLISLLIGHAIIQHSMEVAELNGAIYSGPTNIRMTDLAFMLLGIVVGILVKYAADKNNIQKIIKNDVNKG